jgi:hypothetical protein
VFATASRSGHDISIRPAADFSIGELAVLPLELRATTMVNAI